MTHHSTTAKGFAALALAAALLGGAATTAPAAAQDRGPGFGGPDRPYGYGFEPGSPQDRRGERQGWGSWNGRPFGFAPGYELRAEIDRVAREQFERGYRAGRQEERFRTMRRFGTGGDGRERFASPRWNNPWQRESMERLEMAAARLREALVLMQRQGPEGRRGEQALEQARQALIRVQNAMTWLPRQSDLTGSGEEAQFERRPGQRIGAYRASGGWRS